MATKLYVIPGSHPAMAARLMLDYKGIEYERVDLMPVIHRYVIRLLRFPARTVPALKLDDRRVQGSREISRCLDEVRPEPPLFPRDPELRAAVEDAERWGDETYQSLARRILWASFRRGKEPLRSFAEGAKLPIPLELGIKTAPPLIWLAGRNSGGRDDNRVRADLAALPGILDRIDSLIAAGTLNGEALNAADFQIATSTRLLMALDDVRPAIAGRPAGEHALRVVPEFPGHVPPILPAEWLAPLAQEAPVTA